MNILVLNGSPRKKGNTEIMADAFIKGALEQGHQVEKVNLGHMKIAPCLACEFCFTHNGVCVQKDDMAEILDKVDNADMIVFASPIYWFSISAQLKAAIDRLYARAKKDSISAMLRCFWIPLPMVFTALRLLLMRIPVPICAGKIKGF